MTGEKTEPSWSLNDLSPAHQAAIDSMKDQLLIVFVRKLGGKLVIPIAEVDDTAGYALLFGIDHDARTFTFEARKK